MKTFKFLNKPITTDYRGDMSQEVIRLIFEYISGGYIEGYSQTTDIAEYRIQRTNWDGVALSTAHVIAYPHNENFRIIFHVNSGNLNPYITEHTIDYDRI